MLKNSNNSYTYKGKCFQNTYISFLIFDLTQPIISIYQMQTHSISLKSRLRPLNTMRCYVEIQSRIWNRSARNIYALPLPSPQRLRTELLPDMNHECEVLTGVDKLLDVWVGIKDRGFCAILPPPISLLSELTHYVRLSKMCTVEKQALQVLHQSSSTECVQSCPLQSMYEYTMITIVHIGLTSVHRIHYEVYHENLYILILKCPIGIISIPGLK